MYRQLPTGLHGRITHRRQVGQLALSEVAYPAGLVLPSHAHEHGYFCLVLRGGYTETCQSGTTYCKPMTILYRAPGEPHVDHFHDSGGRCAVIEIPNTWVARLCQGPVKPETAEYQGGPLLRLALGLGRELRNWDDVSCLAIQGLALEMLAEAARGRTCPAERPRPPWLERCRALLHARFRERIPLEEVARELHVHPSHLVRTFRRQHRCTMGEYVRRLRVDYACRRLAAPGASVLEVALDAGFCDQSQFCKTFKRHTGLTPTAFRLMHAR
jgi:AraC family transcriptional regulator